jgi:hypothetical protein
LQVGIFGTAGQNQGYNVGVYGVYTSDGGGNDWAGYFTGATGVEGVLNIFHSVTVDESATFGSAAFDPATGNGIATVASRYRQFAAGTGSVFGAVYSGVAADGLSGQISSATCAVGAVCAGVYGADGSTPGNRTAGTWAGYFDGNLNVTGTITDSSGPILAQSGPTGIGTYDPTQLATVPSASLLGTYASGLSTRLNLVVDGVGIWEGVRQRFRLSNGETYFPANTNSGTLGGTFYDGAWIYRMYDSWVSYYRISDASLYPAGGIDPGYTFPVRHEPYFAGDSAWGVACSGSSARLIQLRRDLQFRLLNSGYNVNLPENPSTPSCIDNSRVQGAYVGATPYLWVSHEHETILRINYSNYQNPTVESTHTFPKPFSDHVLVNSPGGPGWWYAGGYLWVNQPVAGGAVNAGDTVLKVDPVTWATVATYTGYHADWMSDDGTWLWMIEEPTRILRTLKLSDGTPGPTKTLTGTDKLGQIVFDGTAFWIQGTGADQNLYKYLH